MTVGMDVTGVIRRADHGDRRAMMEAVQKRAVPWEDLFATTSVPMSVIDAHGRQVAFNDAYAEFLGYESAEIEHLDVGRVTRPEDQAWTQRYLMRLVSGEIDRFDGRSVGEPLSGGYVLLAGRCHGVAIPPGGKIV